MEAAFDWVDSPNKITIEIIEQDELRKKGGGESS